MTKNDHIKYWFKRMVTQQSAINISNNFIKDILSIGINLKKAYLYGSFSRNTQHEHSDIDLALFADEFDGFGPDDIKLFIDVLCNYNLIHTKTYPTNDINDPDPFLKEIIRTGFEIF
jgi:uncharacterized protein